MSDTKPDCPLIGADGNIFNLMAIASRTLKKAGQPEQAEEMNKRVRSSESYDEALMVIGDYVNLPKQIKTAKCKGGRLNGKTNQYF